jgi:hypothetical protein
MDWLWLIGVLAQGCTFRSGSVGIWVARLNQRRQLKAQIFIEFSAHVSDRSVAGQREPGAPDAERENSKRQIVIPTS